MPRFPCNAGTSWSSLVSPEEPQRQHRLEMTLQNGDYPPVLLLGTSGRVPSKANQPPLFLYFLCCFRCVHADMEQMGQVSSKATLCCHTHARTGIFRQGLGYSIGKSHWRLKTAGGQLDKKGTSRAVGCTKYFSNPQLPFPTIHLSETSPNCFSLPSLPFISQQSCCLS